MHVDAFSLPVETRAPTGTTNAYLLGTEDCLLVDPAARTDTLDTVVAARDVATIAVTHTHPDHVGAVADYAAETGARVLARRPDRFREATGVDPAGTIAEGTVIETGVGPVTVLDTPGHAADHVAFELPDGSTNGPGDDGGRTRGGTVICGDLAVAEGSVVVGAPEGDLRGYLTSLRRLHARNPRRLYPGHGPAVGGDDDPGGPRRVLARLIRHRLDREAKVLAAVRGGADDLDAVLDGAYGKDLTGVRDLARATVAAHLEKLAVEGRVDWDPATGHVSER
jgi:ribonuclease/clavin/mitogillin